MVRLRKHIAWLKFFEFSSSLDEKIQVSSKRDRITRDIDELEVIFGFQFVQEDADIVVETFSGRIKENKSDLIYFFFDDGISADKSFSFSSDKIGFV